MIQSSNELPALQLQRIVKPCLRNCEYPEAFKNVGAMSMFKRRSIQD